MKEKSVEPQEKLMKVYHNSRIFPYISLKPSVIKRTTKNDKEMALNNTVNKLDQEDMYLEPHTQQLKKKCISQDTWKNH